MGAEAVHQFTPIARPGDAVFDHAAQLQKIFRGWGKRSEIYVLDPGRQPMDGVRHYKKYRSGPDDILVYHFGIGSPLTDFILAQPGAAYLIYHNMTPGEYLLGVDNRSYLAVRRGRRELDRLRGRLAGVFADSRYNAEDLETGHGYTGVRVMPIPKDFSGWNGRRVKSDNLTVFTVS